MRYWRPRRWLAVVVLLLGSFARVDGQEPETTPAAAPARADSATAQLLDRWDALMYSPMRDGLIGVIAGGTGCFYVPADDGGFKQVSGKFRMSWRSSAASAIALKCDDPNLAELLRPYLPSLAGSFRPKPWREEFAGCRLTSTAEGDGRSRIAVAGKHEGGIQSVIIDERGLAETLIVDGAPYGIAPEESLSFKIAYEPVGNQYVMCSARAEYILPNAGDRKASFEWEYEYKQRGSFKLLSEVQFTHGSHSKEVSGYSMPVMITLDDFQTEQETKETDGVFGTLRSADGTPVVGACVEVYWADDSKCYGTDYTNANGEYFVAIPASDRKWRHVESARAERARRAGGEHDDDESDEAAGSEKPAPVEPMLFQAGPEDPKGFLQRHPPEKGSWCGTCQMGRWQSDMEEGWDTVDLLEAGPRLLADLLEDELRIEFWTQDCLLARTDPILLSKGERHRLNFQLPVRAPISCRVIDTRGEPVVDAEVVLKGGIGSNGELLYAKSTVSADGKIALALHPFAGALLEIGAPGFQPRDLFVAATGGEATVTLERSEQSKPSIAKQDGHAAPDTTIEVVGTASIHGKVVYPDKLDPRLQPDRVSVLPIGSTEWPADDQESPRWKDEGFQIKKLLPGRYRLVVTSRREGALGRLWAARDIEVNAGEDCEVNIERASDDLGILLVHAQGANGETPHRAWASLLLPTGEDISPRVWLDDRGVLKSALFAGTYSLRVEAIGYASTTIKDVTVLPNFRKVVDVVLQPLAVGGADLASFFREDPQVIVAPGLPWNTPQRIRYDAIPPTSLRALLEMIGSLTKQGISLDPKLEQSGVLETRKEWRWRASASRLLEHALTCYGLHWSATADGRVLIHAPE